MCNKILGSFLFIDVEKSIFSPDLKTLQLLNIIYPERFQLYTIHRIHTYKIHFKWYNGQIDCCDINISIIDLNSLNFIKYLTKINILQLAYMLSLCWKKIFNQNVNKNVLALWSFSFIYPIKPN